MSAVEYKGEVPDVHDGEWHVSSSEMALRTSNPIRQIVDSMNVTGSCTKEPIKLSIGDPTVFGNLPRAPQISQALMNAIASGKYEGYPPADGYESSRKAVADYFSEKVIQASKLALGEENALVDCNTLAATDVILASGCSHALDMVISGICNPGDNILIPRPAFALYKTITDCFELEARYYNLDASKHWQVDCKDLEEQIDSRTKAILVSNPSNPCGSVFSKEHLMEILQVAEKHKLAIIADEIYWDMVFSKETFVPLASVSVNVPIISVGAISKRYLVPGWRLGWIMLFDREKRLQNLRKGLIMLAQRIVGPNSLVQGALPEILKTVPETFNQELNAILEDQAMYCVEKLSNVTGLRPVVPQGTMYIMVEVLTSMFSDIENDVDFCSKLLSEENVMVLPGKAFAIDNFFRIVFCGPKVKLGEAVDRIAEFVSRHMKQ